MQKVPANLSDETGEEERTRAGFPPLATQEYGSFRQASLLSEASVDGARAMTTGDETLGVLRPATLTPCRNATPSIYTFPSEIWAHIFRMLSDSDPYTTESLGWVVQATHVCRMWRAVALNEATLWHRAVLDMDPTWVKETINRSKAAALDVSIRHTQTETVEPKLLIVQDQLPRTASLSMVGFGLKNPMEGVSSLGDILNAPAPVLEALKVIPWFYSHDGVSLVLRDTEVPDGSTLFAGTATKLRALYLKWLFIPWRSLLHIPLVDLEVCTNLFFDNNSLHLVNDPDHILDLLAGLPDLERWVLHGCLPDSSIPPRRQRRSLPLPRLNHLGLAGGPDDVASFFSLLKLPGTVTIDIHNSSYGTSRDPSRHPGYPSALIPPFMEHFRDSDECSLRGLRGLCITTRDWGHHVVMPEGGRTRFSIDSPRHNTHHPHWFEFDTTIRPYLALTFDGSDDHTIFPQFTEMFRGESLEELRQLFIFGHSQSSRDRLLLPWQEIFKSAVNVDTMCASGSGAITFVKALSCTIDAAPEGEHGAAPGDGAGAPPAVTVSLFPKLRRLLVDEIECTPRGAINLRRELLTAKTLIKIMHSRKLRNMPLDTLGFRGCIFEREEEMDVLRAEITGSIVMDEPRFCFEDPSSYVDELHRYGISE